MSHQFESLVARSLDESRSDRSGQANQRSGQANQPPREKTRRTTSRDRSRTKMISFRVSDEEFEILRRRSEAEGARNISEYARMALCERPRSSDADLRRLSSEIQRLGANVARVTLLIEHGTTWITPPTAGPKRE